MQTICVSNTNSAVLCISTQKSHCSEWACSQESKHKTAAKMNFTSLDYFSHNFYCSICMLQLTFALLTQVQEPFLVRQVLLFV